MCQRVYSRSIVPPQYLGDRVARRAMSRRDFMWLISASTAGVACSSLLGGCATDPVTGETTLVGLSEQQEIQLDKQNSPHQFSADYGAVRDPQLNGYLNQVGRDLAGRSHRPQMPYSFRAVNANHVNAYAFPGGSIAVTRGLMAELENEAELAALLGHEVGHVNARHAAEQAGTQLIAQAVVVGAAVYAGSKKAGAGNLVSMVGSIGAGALLAHYSRNNEREADSLGMEYMTRSQYNPEGMVGLTDVLRSQHKKKPSALDLMFATHPMSEERYQTAQKSAHNKYAQYQNAPFYKERYMDHTVQIRELKPAIEALQKAEKSAGNKRYHEAEEHARTALAHAPEDYAAHIIMGKIQSSLNKPALADLYFTRAKEIYPEEAQAFTLSGISKLSLRQYQAAYNAFATSQRLLPGNPNSYFLKGLALESMNNYRGARNEYVRYLQTVNQGAMAKHAYDRLVQWGYIQPQR